MGLRGGIGSFKRNLWSCRLGRGAFNAVTKVHLAEPDDENGKPLFNGKVNFPDYLRGGVGMLAEEHKDEARLS
jgi:hypothetical protein